MVCRTCAGLGKTLVTDDECLNTEEIDCPRCGGSGAITTKKVILRKSSEIRGDLIGNAIKRTESKYGWLEAELAKRNNRQPKV